MLFAVLRRLARDRSGASAAEYALLLGVIGTGLVLASFNLGQAIASSLERSASLFASIEPSDVRAAATAADAPRGEESPASADPVPESTDAGTDAKSNPHNNNGSSNGNPKSANNNGKGSGKF